MALVGELIRGVRRPGSIAVAQSAVWVVSEPSVEDVTLVHIEPSSKAVLGQPIQIPEGHRLQVGAGVLWVVYGPNVLRVDANSGTILGEIRLEGEWSTGIPEDLVVAEDFVWVSNNEANIVTRLDARTGEIVGSPIKVGTHPRGLSYDGDSVWVTNAGFSGEGLTATRIEASTGEVLSHRIPIEGVIVAAGGSLWVVGGHGGGITRFDPAAEQATDDHIVVEGFTQQFAFGTDSFWVTVNGPEDHLARVDPHSKQIVDRISLDDVGGPGPMAVGEDEVWISLPGEDAVMHIAV